MKTKLLKRLSLLICLLMIATAPVISHAEEGDAEIAKEESALNEDAKHPQYEAALKEKYNLTDEQLKSLRDQGMNNQQITITAQLASLSGKSIDEVAKMRTEQDMGWGKIAKELGVHPGEIGKGISSMRHSLNEKRMEKKAEKREARAAKAEEKLAKRKEKKEQKLQEKAERHEKKAKG